MIKIVRRLFLYPVLFSIISINLLSCDDDGGKKIVIKGNVANASATVVAILNGSIVDSDETDLNGNYRLRVPNRFNSLQLRFETTTFNVARVIQVTPDSQVTFDVSLEPGMITILNWQVLQERLRLSGNDTFEFNESEADLTINGNRKDCINTRGGSIIDISARNITLVDCGEGIISEGSSSIVLESTEKLNITARENGIRSKNNSSVLLTSDNSIFISSNSEDGIRATGTSEVIVDPAITCTIFGSNKAISEGSNTSIDTGGCNLAEG